VEALNNFFMEFSEHENQKYDFFLFFIFQSVAAIGKCRHIRVPGNL